MLGGLMLFVACHDQVDHGLDSLEGLWTLSKIIEIENEVLEFGTASLSQIDNENPGGSFEFSDASVEYNYVLSTGELMSVDDYSLSHARENSGFTKVDVFTLVIGNRVFNLEFGDQTKKSYKDATEIRLTETTVEDDREFVTILEMSK